MAIEFGSEFFERQDAIRNKHDESLAKLHGRLCPIDARELRADGTCPACGRNIAALRAAPAKAVEKSAMSDEERLKAERLAAFWKRFNRERAEREAGAARERQTNLRGPEPSRADRAKRFLTADGWLREM